METVLQKIKKLPKADLHNHLTLGSNITTLKKYYQNCNLIIPKQYNGLEGMFDFVHEQINAVMITANDMIRFMEIAIEGSIDDNIVLLEASVDINLRNILMVALIQ